jgi:hypothetical protein
MSRISMTWFLQLHTQRGIRCTPLGIKSYSKLTVSKYTPHLLVKENRSWSSDQHLENSTCSPRYHKLELCLLLLRLHLPLGHWPEHPIMIAILLLSGTLAPATDLVDTLAHLAKSCIVSWCMYAPVWRTNIPILAGLPY